MENILVTGCNGLIGQEVVKGLLKEGFKVTGIDNRETSDFNSKNFSFIKLDLTSELELTKLFAMNDFSHVIHLAAIAHSIKGVKISWSRYYRINTLISRRIFQLASKKQIPIFFASTIDVYGIQTKIIDDNIVPNPIGHYAKSKFLAENALREIAQQPYLIARFAPIYSDNNRNDIHKRYYIRYPKIAYLFGDGVNYEFLHVDNVVRLVLKWVNVPERICGIINVVIFIVIIQNT